VYTYGWKQTEVIMSQKTFSRVAAALFLLVALGHLLRIAFGASVVVQNVSIPMWLSWIAFVVAGYLAYQGFRLARRSLLRL
jgi:divalent metal cation (Fe/Co/Zn/Cd) transporter